MPIEPTNDPFMDDKPELSKILELCILLSQPLDPDYLLEMLLETTQELTRADGATLYLMDSNPDQSRLFFEIVKNKTLQVSMGGSSETPCNFPPLALYNPQTKEPNFTNIATFVALHKTFVNIEDAYSQKEFDFAGTREMDRNMKYHSKSFLCFPVMDANGDVAAVIQLINAKNSTGETVAFSRMAEYITHALTSLASIAIDNSRLKKVQRTLTEAFITVTAKAIDTKSPYAGAHCQRVPIITNMLAAAATMADTGPLKDFEMTEDEWNCLHLASWLHDCGKVTTPDYIIDKATKLETIYNRIHEIRARFEIMRRDAHIEYLKKRLSGKFDTDALLKDFNDKVHALESDYKFLADQNTGNFVQTKEDRERIKKIASKRYVRNFDRTSGLSWDEQTRIAGSPPPPPPVYEHVLEDRPDHLFQEYNRGELYNMLISRGTITPEESKKINDHIVQTAEFLKMIPFPKNLTHIMEYATNHHERIDGSGFPNGLTGEEMSIPAKIMAIADVFEALSSTDRPYKPAKKLMEIVSILSLMAKSNQLDADLFNLFLTSGVYKKYAEGYMKKEQMEEFDITPFMV